MKASLLLLSALVALASAERVHFKGYKTYVANPRTVQDLKVLQLLTTSQDVDFWTQVRGVNDPVTMMIAPEMQEGFVKLMKLYNIQYTTLIEDVESTVESERLRQARAPRVPKGRVSFDSFLRYEEIQDYINGLAEQYPDIVQVETIGKTYEGRDLSLIRIGAGPSSNPNILIDAAIHAREWIAPSQALYIIQELVENPINRFYIEHVNWHIVPVLNPDGYEYTHTNSRFWRKTRSTGATCDGVDGNRNFDYQWMVTGASSNPCSETFAGPQPFSEAETTAFSNYALSLDSIDLYLAIHSYGQYILYPWGWTSALPDNAPQLHALGVAVNNAIYGVAGTRYTVGSSTNVLYAAAGASDDWAFAVGGAPLSYTLELPGGGSQGFDIPAYRIADVVAETWEGIKVFHDYVEQNARRR